MARSETANARRERIIGALLRCPTLDAAAREAGIGRSTIRRWLADTGFAADYRKARAQVTDHAISLCQQAAGAAVATLCRNLRSGQPASEIAAARAILQTAVDGVALADVQTRLDELEARLGGL